MPPRSYSHPQPFTDAAVEAICRALAEAVAARQIAALIAPLRTYETPADRAGAKWRRLFGAVAAAQQRQGDGRPLLRLVTEIMAPVRFYSSDDFESHRAAVNERLVMYGYAVRADGRIEQTDRALTLSEAQQRADGMRAELERRGVHRDVLRFCRPELMQRDYFHAVLEASKSVADRLRGMTGVSADGSKLVDVTCMASSGMPMVTFNGFTTEWEKSEQRGVATVIKGMFSMYRNPTAHAPRLVWATSEQDALDALTLASMIHRRLDEATVLHPQGGQRSAEQPA
jgi:uncharacterized protein (TIGR02391 family)